MKACAYFRSDLLKDRVVGPLPTYNEEGFLHGEISVEGSSQDDDGRYGDACSKATT